MIDRRNFLQMAVGGAAAAHARPISAATSRGVLGANDRVRVGLIGCGSRGNQVSRDWMKHPDSVFVAACDAYKERLDQTVERIAGVQGTSPEAYEDYRRILDRKDVDAVFIATPDHWHSPMTVDACAAGKDVYVEKPASHNIVEGRTAVKAARDPRRSWTGGCAAGARAGRSSATSTCARTTDCCTGPRGHSRSAARRGATRSARHTCGAAVAGRTPGSVRRRSTSTCDRSRPSCTAPGDRRCG